MSEAEKLFNQIVDKTKLISNILFCPAKTLCELADIENTEDTLENSLCQLKSNFDQACLYLEQWANQYNLWRFQQTYVELMRCYEIIIEVVKKAKSKAGIARNLHILNATLFGVGVVAAVATGGWLLLAAYTVPKLVTTAVLTTVSSSVITKSSLCVNKFGKQVLEFKKSLEKYLAEKKELEETELFKTIMQQFQNNINIS